MSRHTINLKAMLLNAENLFLLSDKRLEKEFLQLEESEWQKLSTSVYANKPLQKLIALKKVIAEVNPDVLMLAEVGGNESLENFNRLFLNESYSPALIEGNSDRNIDIGYLIKKNLGFYFDLISNKNRPINFNYPHEQANTPSHKFSRDVAELHLFTQSREKPFLIFLLTHLKSRLDRDNIDMNGFYRRQAELKTLLTIYSELTNKHPNVPIVVAGDFNGNASKQQTEPEFQDIYQATDLQDVCYLAKLKQEECSTYYQVAKNVRTEGKQIDFCFLSKNCSRYLQQESVQIYRYKDHLGQPQNPPTTIDAKLNLPSDHYPVIFQLNQIPLID